MTAEATFETHNPRRFVGGPLAGPRSWALLIGVVTVVVVARRPSIVFHATLWLEDAGVFLRGARAGGFGSLIHPYNGYFHTVPRLVALVVDWLPIAWTPTLYAVSAAVLSAGCCAMVMSTRLQWLFRSRGRQWMALVALLALPRIDEIQATLTNSIWWIGLALLLCILSDDPATRGGRVTEGALVALFVLSGANGVLLAPFFMMRVYRTRSPHSWRILGIWWLAAGVQLVALAMGSRPDPGEVPTSLVDLGRWAMERTVGPLVLGGNWVGRREHLVDDYRLRYTLLVVIATAGLALVILVGHAWSTSVVVLGVSAVAIAAGLVASGGFARWLPGRYTAIPIAALLIGLASAHPPPRLVRNVQYFLAIWIVVVRPFDLAIPTRPAIDWDPTATCFEQRAEVCAVPMNPEGSAPPALIPRSD